MTVSRRSRGLRERRAALVLAVSIATLVTAKVADAQPVRGHAPWCADLGAIGWAVLECSYHTFEQCRAAVWGVSNSCTVNPWYLPERGPIRRPHRAYR